MLTAHMPIYEYKCSQCATEFEVFLVRSDEVAQCPSCEGKELDKLLSAPSRAPSSAADFTAPSNCAQCPGRAQGCEAAN